VGKPKTSTDIVTWAENKVATAETPSYTRLTRADHRTIMHLHDEGLTLTAIAQRLNRSVSTIHEVVQIYEPTDDLAKRKLRGSALQMAENIVENGQPRDHVAALKGIGVLEPDRADIKWDINLSLPWLPKESAPVTDAVSVSPVPDGGNS
jgi:hypothetical protein